MNKTALSALLAEHKTIRKMAEAGNTSYTNIRYWLRKHGLTTNTGPAPIVHLCSCGETNPANFYGRRRKFCKKCFNKQVTEIWRVKKRRAIELMGGECERCALRSDHICIYDFHHKQGTKKEMQWAELVKFRWSKIVEELAKCELLCSNCHRIEHEGSFNHGYHGHVSPLFPKESKG